MKKEELEIKKTKFLEWLASEDRMADNGILSVLATFDDADRQILETMFTKEQLVFLKNIIKGTIWLIEEWHNELNEESHEDIRKEITKFKTQFRNHRHEKEKSYTAKPEW